jgi:PTH1 family peptidyl-tRNA hydrolase
MTAVRLIVGLGNPGPRFEGTRHNVGAVFVENLARRFGITLREDQKFKGLVGRGDVLGHDVRLLIPTTYMNLSGESVGAMANFFKLAVNEVLVVQDEVAFEPGVIRLKAGGGDNGHNGLRSIIASLGNNAGFLRLRIGVGHPGDRERVTSHLTSVTMPANERADVERACGFADDVLATILAGELQAAMNALHKPAEPMPTDKGTDG